MNIAIYGMGYVGMVSGVCLVRDGHSVIGIDPVEAKVADINRGRSPIQEPEVPRLLAEAIPKKLLKASTHPADGVRDSDMCWICVGTPSTMESGVDLEHVKAVIGQIGAAIRTTGNRPLIVVRSTVLPGTTAGVILAELESATGMQVGKDLHLVFHPEFLREGTAVSDFDNPPKIVIGEHTSGHGDRLMQLYERKNQYMAPKFRLTLNEAEMVKYCDNVFHALKITFANEMGAIARSAGVDARRVAEVFCSDTKLNISPHYLRPGFAFGGSCLPKELRAISRYATMHALPTPMIRGILDSNAAQINALTERVKARQPRNVGMVGIAFKPQTDDMRESPFVTVAKALIGEGISVVIYDPAVNVGKLIGSNKRAVEIAMGHLKEMLVDTLDQLDGCDTILINHPTVDSKKIQAWATAGSHVIDLCGIKGVDRKTPGYEGIAW